MTPTISKLLNKSHKRKPSPKTYSTIFWSKRLGEGVIPPPPPKKKNNNNNNNNNNNKNRKGMGNQTTALRLQTGGWHEWPDIASLLLGAGKTELWFRNKNWKSGHSLTLASLASGLYIDIYASFNSQHIHSKMIIWHPHSDITSRITVVSKRRTVHGKGFIYMAVGFQKKWSSKRAVSKVFH